MMNQPDWKSYGLIGFLLFMVFYWIIPAWLNHELISLQSSTLQLLFMKRIAWIQCSGLGLGLFFTLIAIRNYLRLLRLNKTNKK